MDTFKEFLSSQPTTHQKWKANKEQILDYWQKLRPDTPIQMSPILSSHKGSTYGEDGIRITGSPQFIGSTLGRLKEFLHFESPTSKLALSYRETSPPGQLIGQTKTSYVFYIASKERGQNSKI